MIFIQVFSAEGPISFSRLDAMKLSTSNKYRKMKVQRRNFLTKLSSFQSHTDAVLLMRNTLFLPLQKKL